MTSASLPDSISLTVSHRFPAGLIAGLIGSLFGLIGIFAFPIVFSPLAIVCGVIGLVAAVIGRSGGGIGTSALAMVLAVLAAIKSPTVWLLLGAGILAANAGATAKPEAPAILSTAKAEQGATETMPSAPVTAAEIEIAIVWVEGFSRRAGPVLKWLPEVEARYRGISELMAADLQRLPVISDPVERSQVAVALSQRAVESDQLQAETEALRNAIKVALAREQGPSLQTIEKCRAASAAAGDGCRRLAIVGKQLDTNLAALLASFERLEAVYRVERPRQEEIIRQADVIVSR